MSTTYMSGLSSQVRFVVFLTDSLRLVVSEVAYKCYAFFQPVVAIT